MAGFEDVLAYIGFEDPELILQDKTWQFWAASFSSPFGEKEQRHLLFLNSSASWKSAEKAADEIRGLNFSGGFKAVVRDSASISGNLKKLKHVTRAGSADTVRGIMSQVFDRLTRDPEGDDAEYKLGSEVFVEPYVKTGHDHGPQHAVSCLRDWLLAESSDGPRIGVLLAPAAVGKTTVARQLDGSIRRSNRGKRYPLLVDSQQWGELIDRAELTVTDLWEIAMKTLYRDRLSSDNLETAVSAGLLVPIFDGFDELCTRMNGQFSPEETLGELSDLLADTDGRILVTARDVFWDQLFEQPPDSTAIFRLQPFDDILRKKYLSQRFGGDEAARQHEDASRILEALDREERVVVGGVSETSLASVPLVVELACESAELVDGSSNPQDTLIDYTTGEGNSPLHAVLVQLLERDQLRLKLGLTGLQQLGIFELLATEFSSPYTLEELRLCGIEATGLKESAKDLVALNQSVLLREEKGCVVFRFDFVREHVVANRTKDLVQRYPDELRALKKVLKQYPQGGVIALEEAARRLAEADYAGTVEKLHSLCHSEVSGFSPAAQSGLAHLALAAIRFGNSGMGAVEIADIFFEVMGDGKEISGLHLEGRFDKLSLEGKVFRDCTFEKGGFGRCKFDETTSFEGSTFHAPFEFIQCQGLSRIDIDGIKEIEAPVLEALQRELGTSRVPPAEGQIRDVMRLNLKKFQRGYAFKPLKRSAMFRGRGGTSALAGPVWDALEKSGLVQDQSTSSDCMIITPDARGDLHRFLDNNVTTGLVLQAINLATREITRPAV